MCGTPEFVAPEVVNYDFIDTSTGRGPLSLFFCLFSFVYFHISHSFSPSLFTYCVVYLLLFLALYSSERGHALLKFSWMISWCVVPLFVHFNFLCSTLIRFLLSFSNYLFLFISFAFSVTLKFVAKA